jgi:capsular polysaccharide biosynthesis protein
MVPEERGVMNTYQQRPPLMDSLNVIWKRKWPILAPTLFLVVAVIVIDALIDPKYEVDIVFQPSRFLVQTELGELKEVMASDSKQVADQINEQSYDGIVAAALKIDLREFPRLRALALSDTKLVRVVILEKDVEKAKSILAYLYSHMQKDLDRKAEVELITLDARIATQQNLIKQTELVIQDNLNEIKLKEIEKNKTRQEIASVANKLKISEERRNSLSAELKSVKARIKELEDLLKQALAEKKEGIDAVGLLLYSNEVQNNLRYYNDLEEKLSEEKVNQEDLNMLAKEKNEELRRLDTEIAKLNTEIDKNKNKIESVNTEITLLRGRKGRIDKTQLIKEPTSSLDAVTPRKMIHIVLAVILGLMGSTTLALFVEYVNKYRDQPPLE